MITLRVRMSLQSFAPIFRLSTMQVSRCSNNRISNSFKRLVAARLWLCVCRIVSVKCSKPSWTMLSMKLNKKNTSWKVWKKIFRTSMIPTTWRWSRSKRSLRKRSKTRQLNSLKSMLLRCVSLSRGCLTILRSHRLVMIRTMYPSSSRGLRMKNLLESKSRKIFFSSLNRRASKKSSSLKEARR